MQGSEGAVVASNYEAICSENKERYGTDIARIGPMLLADRYDDRTHFIFELLQNAEDALAKRGSWAGSRSASFSLTEKSLVLKHFGKPFDERDVRGICGIAESTKDEESIGRFGIGFKSVYTFTDCPEIHSGSEHFVIRNFVQPAAAENVTLSPDETLILLPLKEEDSTARQEIISGFKGLGPGALLFLRSISEINWTADGASGFYLRDAPEALGDRVKRIKLIGQEKGQEEIDQDWLVFHRDVSSPSGRAVGRVEVAFALEALNGQPSRWGVTPVPASPLVVFFPTALETNLGFLVQGPFLTTPSRDNILRNDPWNKHLVDETASLLIEALRWMRDKSILDTSALSCLPLEREKFPDGALFAPLFNAVKNALAEEELLPRFQQGYMSASKARLARTQDLRELFSPDQITQIFDGEASAWLSGEITQDRTPALRKYVMQELGVTEVTPTTLIPRLTRGFLEAQSDLWILKLYEYLSGQEAALRRRLETIPLLRLVDGNHVQVRENGKPRAFLPSAIDTSFPTIRPTVCASDEAKRFLVSLGITEPDPVDDVIWNVLPKHGMKQLSLEDNEYARDIERIRSAFNTDSKTQREKLVAALRDTAFLRVIDAGDGKGYRAKPGMVYLATDRLKQLFEGVPNVYIVDDRHECLRGEAMRELLEACNAVRYPRPMSSPDLLSHDELAQLRRSAGHEQTSGINDRVQDWTLQGFDALLEGLPTYTREQRAERARLIWESLADLEERRGRSIFEGEYRWTHHGSYRKEFPAAFIRRLKAAAWVPDGEGELQPPQLVIFEDLGWKANPFLLSIIPFKPPIIDQLAKEAGIDPAALDLLRKLGITSVADLTTWLGIQETLGAPADEVPISPKVPANEANSGDVYGDAADLYGDDMPDIPDGKFASEDGDAVARSMWGANLSGADDRSLAGASGGGSGTRSSASSEGLSGQINRGGSGHSGSGKRAPGSQGGRPFVSYVASHPDDEATDPDGLDQELRMKLEAAAIDKITQLEPALKRTAEGNRGFDLYELDASGNPLRWVEVKSMTGSLADRPVGMSRAQFDFAREKGDAYWLYVVEYASELERARILRIRNPAGQARTFTFDHGWANLAQELPHQSSVNIDESAVA